MSVPSVEVRFENLNVSANIQIGSRALPTLLNYTRDGFEVINIAIFFLQFFLLIIFFHDRTLFYTFQLQDLDYILVSYIWMQSMLTALGILRPERHSLTILNSISGAVKPGRSVQLLIGAVVQKRKIKIRNYFLSNILCFMFYFALHLR